MMLDNIDRRILQILQVEGRLTNADLARRVNLSPPATFARLKRLEEQGYIRDYVALVDPDKLGYDMLCFVQVRLQLHQLEQVAGFRKAIQGMSQVLECHHVTGEYDYLLKVLVRNRRELERFLLECLTPIPGVAHIHTSLVLSQVKTTTALSVE